MGCFLQACLVNQSCHHNRADSITPLCCLCGVYLDRRCIRTAVTPASLNLAVPSVSWYAQAAGLVYIVGSCGQKIQGSTLCDKLGLGRYYHQRRWINYIIFSIMHVPMKAYPRWFGKSSGCHCGRQAMNSGILIFLRPGAILPIIAGEPFLCLWIA